MYTCVVNIDVYVCVCMCQQSIREIYTLEHRSNIFGLQLGTRLRGLAATADMTAEETAELLASVL